MLMNIIYFKIRFSSTRTCSSSTFPNNSGLLHLCLEFHESKRKLICQKALERVWRMHKIAAPIPSLLLSVLYSGHPWEFYTYHHQRVDFVFSSAILVSGCCANCSMESFKWLFFLRLFGPFGTEILSKKSLKTKQINIIYQQRYKRGYCEQEPLSYSRASRAFLSRASYLM